MIVKVDDISVVIPTSNSPKGQWITYYKNLEKNFSKNDAKEIFLITWQYEGAFSHTTDPEFNDFFAKKGINLPNATGLLIAGSRSAAGGVADLVSSAFNIGKYAVPIITGSVLLIVLYFLFNVAKKGNISDVAMALPQGRAVKAAGLLGK